MVAAIELRADFSDDDPRQLARNSGDAKQVRRLGLRLRRDLSGRRQGAGIVMPFRDTPGDAKCLAEISALVVLENITIPPLPPRVRRQRPWHRFEVEI